MKILPFLRMDQTRQYDSHITEDLQLNHLLSSNAMRILRTPCLPPYSQTIANRQAFFSCMEDQAFRIRLDSFRSALLTLKKQSELKQTVQTEIELLCQSVQTLKAYCQVCDALSALANFTPLLDEAIAALYTPDHQTLLTQMKNDLADANTILQSISASDLVLTDKAWLVKDSNSVSYCERIAALAAQIEISVKLTSERPIKIDVPLSNAITELYGDEINRLQTIVRIYSFLEINAPLSWLSELNFFLEIHALVEKAHAAGIATCLPTISPERLYYAEDASDISLFAKNCPHIVPNNIDFTEADKFCFLTGANGGGKTTYLRTVGINLLFFLSGCPIFARKAQIYPYSGLFTHFPEDERFSGMGRLDAELNRVNRMIDAADQNSFILFNETFSATDEIKGFQLACSTAQNLRDRGIFGLFVTHFHEIADQGFPILSVRVEEGEGHRRTYKIYRNIGEKSSYARDILKKYRLDRMSLAERRAKNEYQSFISE